MAWYCYCWKHFTELDLDDPYRYHDWCKVENSKFKCCHKGCTETVERAIFILEESDLAPDEETKRLEETDAWNNPPDCDMVVIE